MIPTSDEPLTRTVPIVTLILILTNALVFVYLFTLSPHALLPSDLWPGADVSSPGWDQLQRFFQAYAVIPARYFSDQYGVADLGVPIFTSMFLHGDLLHLGGNMLYLWIFGDNVEDRMGPGRFLIFYLLCGVIGTVVHILVSSDSALPTLGASGAIAGVLGAYILLYPEARVTTVIGGYGVFREVRIPAKFLLGFWFVMQLYSGTLSFTETSGQTGGVAWWAHIYGFVAGLALVHLFKRKNDGPKKPDLWPILYSHRRGRQT